MCFVFFSLFQFGNILTFGVVGEVCHAWTGSQNHSSSSLLSHQKLQQNLLFSSWSAGHRQSNNSELVETAACALS